MPRFEIKAFIAVDAKDEAEAERRCEQVASHAEETGKAKSFNAAVVCDERGSLEEVDV